MADVTSIDTHVPAITLKVAIRVDIVAHELRANEAAEMLLCLCQLAGLITGSDYVRLAEEDPAEADRWKSLNLLISEMSVADVWEIMAVLPGCTADQTQAFQQAARLVGAAVRNRKAGQASSNDDEQLHEAAALLVKQSSDVPRTPPMEEVEDIVSRLAALTITLSEVTSCKR